YRLQATARSAEPPGLQAQRLAAGYSPVSPHIIVHPAADQAGFGGWPPPARDDDPAATPGRLVDQLPQELGQADIAKRLRQVVLLKQVGHWEVFNHRDRPGFRQSTMNLMQCVSPLRGDRTVLPAETMCRLPAVLAAPFAAAHRSLQAFDRL